MELRKEVSIFAEGMEQRLRENDFKPGWQNDDIHDLLLRIGDEWWELDKAIKENNYESIIKESRDVGNFAMMIHDICTQKYKK